MKEHKQTKIIIVGGGYGGLKALEYLAKNTNNQIIL